MRVIDYKTPRLGEPGGKPSVVVNSARRIAGLPLETEVTLKEKQRLSTEAQQDRIRRRVFAKM